MDNYNVEFSSVAQAFLLIHLDLCANQIESQIWHLKIVLEQTKPNEIT